MSNIYNQMDEQLEDLKLNIYSPVFEEVLKNLDKELQRVLLNVYEGKFESGDINLKITVDIKDDMNEVPVIDNDTGEIVNKEVKFRKPKFEYKTYSTLKKKHENKVTYEENREIVKTDEDNFVARTLIDPQIKFRIEEGKKSE